MSNYTSTDVAETATFCLLIDTFFDIMNIWDINSHKFDLKPSVIPFSSIPGFLGYEMYFCSTSMTGFIPLNTVKVTCLEMQKIKCLFHSKHMWV